jgi:hypothetical protein
VGPPGFPDDGFLGDGSGNCECGMFILTHHHRHPSLSLESRILRDTIIGIDTNSDYSQRQG